MRIAHAHYVNEAPYCSSASVIRIMFVSNKCANNEQDRTTTDVLKVI